MTSHTQSPAETLPAESAEQRFRRLEAVWEAETLYLSDAHRIIQHPAFQEIIGLGEEVIPLMLADLEREPRHWVWALPRITGANPVPPSDGGNIRKMAEAWLRWGTRERLSMVEHLKALFPRLRTGSFRVTSERDPVCNCIAWTAGVTNDWWWPLEDPAEGYWPSGVPRERTIEAFREAFATMSYAVCSSDEVEVGFEKIALFADADLPTHAARQLSSGRWTSKLGKGEDIEHDLHDLEGDFYGKVVLVMRRPLPGTTPAD